MQKKKMVQEQLIASTTKTIHFKYSIIMMFPTQFKKTRSFIKLTHSFKKTIHFK